MWPLRGSAETGDLSDVVAVRIKADERLQSLELPAVLAYIRSRAILIAQTGAAFAVMATIFGQFSRPSAAIAEAPPSD